MYFEYNNIINNGKHKLGQIISCTDLCGMSCMFCKGFCVNILKSGYLTLGLRDFLKFKDKPTLLPLPKATMVLVFLRSGLWWF